jgi:flavin reductase (DIM6/NTAB) family NADH-FMN oxidoreductase RutF
MSSQAQQVLETEHPIIDPAVLRRVLGRFATGVAVIAADTPSHGLIGMTVSSFNTVSLDPPLVLFSVARKAYGLSPLLRSACFSVNILGMEHVEVSNRFARPGADKWSDTAFQMTQTGTPVLEGAIAAFECAHYAQHDGGDHVIVLGRVLALHCQHEVHADPLLFYCGRYHAVGNPL